MQEEIQQFQAIYNTLVEFFINYSFQLLGAIIVLLIGLFVAGRVSRWVEKFCLGKELDITLSRFIASAVKIIIVVGIGIIALGKLGISVTPFVAAIGALSLGAGLAVQGLLSNYGAGFNIILTRPFIVWDTINVQGVGGVVDEVHLAYTILKDEDDVRIMIPNKHIVGEIIHNSDSNSLAESSVTVSYAADPQQVIEIVQGVLREQGVSENRVPQVGIDGFLDIGLKVAARYWVPTQKFHETRFKINNGIHAALEANSIEFAVPRQTVNLVNNGG